MMFSNNLSAGAFLVPSIMMTGVKEDGVKRGPDYQLNKRKKKQKQKNQVGWFSPGKHSK